MWTDDPSRSAILLRHSALERNKRCLLAYINDRATKITEMRWQFGPVLPPEVRSQLCEPELTFFNQYNKDMAAYMRAIGDGAGIDLTTDQSPPKSLHVEVRCLQVMISFIVQCGYSKKKRVRQIKSTLFFGYFFSETIVKVTIIL